MSVQLVFGFEYAILMTIVANTVVKYVLHSVDLYSEAPWENKAVFMLYTELFIGLIKVFLQKLPVPKVLSVGCGFGSGIR
jgi:E3 ubiquitin-protein ligase synoviolin